MRLYRERNPAAAAGVIGDRDWITAAAAGVFYPTVNIGETVRAGQVLGEVRDYFGNVLKPTAPGTGVVMNSNVGIPVKADGFLRWIGEIGEPVPSE